MSRVLVIINPVSGPPRRGSAAVRVRTATRALERLGVRGEIRVTTHAGHAHDLALAGVASGAGLIIAWGGDGTINEVGCALVQRGVRAAPEEKRPALGIIPGGSGNGLARELRIPFDSARAIERAIHGEARRVDAGELGGRLFFNVAGVGLDARVAASVSARVDRRGLIPYLEASGRELLRCKPVDYTIATGGRIFPLSALIVALANSRQYGFRAQIAPAALLEDGLLDLVIVEDRKLAGNLVRIPSLFLSSFDRAAGVKTSRVRELTIRSRDPMLFHVDGEPVQGSDSLIARVHPGALRVRA